MNKKSDWRKKYIAMLAQQSKDQAIVQCNCGDIDCLMEVGWWEDTPDLWLSFTLRPLSLWQRIKAIWGILTRDYVWLREIILDADTCDWLGNLLIERAGKMRRLMEAIKIKQKRPEN